jgi:thiol-disulfide isomerase/thioredoxin
MKNIYKDFNKTIKTELIKKKRSGIFSLSFAIGLLLPLIGFIVKINFHLKGEEVVKGIPVNYYFEHLTNSLSPFVFFFFPVLMIYAASKIAQIDHKNKGWHLMETLPTSKFSVYFSKYILLLTSNLIAISTLLIFTFLFVFLESLFFEIASDKLLSFPLADFLEVGLRLFLVSLCISAIQYGLSVLISSFIWPIIIGFIAMLIPLILSDLYIVLNWYPYQLLHQIATYPKGSDFGYWFTYSEVLSLLYAIISLYIGYNWYRFKAFFTAFCQSKRLLKLLGVLLICGTVIHFTLKPKQQELKTKTIIKGEISSDKEVKTVIIFDIIAGDTLAKIPVVNNTFRQEFTQNLNPDYYTLQFDNYTRKRLYFGQNDSVYLNYKLFGTKDKLEVKGTRVSENIQENNFRTYTSYRYYLENNLKIDDANFYMEGIYDDWHTSLKKLNSIRTVDNIIPRSDYKERQTKLLSIEFLNYWNSFKKKRQTLYPDKPYVVNDNMKQLENSVSLTDETLLSNNNYLNYILEDLIKDDNREVSESEKYFAAIKKMDEGLFKDRLLLRQLNNSLSEAELVSVRDSLIDTYLHLISKKSYKDLIISKYQDYNRLSKGASAPDFLAYDTNGKKYNLDSFKGKLVLIDCWASWCGPCKREDPFYERKALMYKNKSIQFISMNSDRREEDWLVDINNKGKSILQLRPEDLNAFGKSYAVNSIPRFILIDTEGKIINSDFVRPSSKVFDELLNTYLQ